MITNEVKTKQKELINYLESLGLDPKLIGDVDLMSISFVHKSYSADFKEKILHNERLEFLGDSALGLIISKILFKDHPEFDESKLTLYKISLVREETLAQVALNIGLNDKIFLGKGEDKSGGRTKHVILADCLEAIIGYIYIDFGIQRVEYFVLKYVYPMLGKIDSISIVSHKTMFQEYVQKEFKELPKYLDFDFEKDKKGNVITYKTQVYVLGELKGEGYGSNKKTAQENAAKDAYEKYKNSI